MPEISVRVAHKPTQMLVQAREAHRNDWVAIVSERRLTTLNHRNCREGGTYKDCANAQRFKFPLHAAHEKVDEQLIL